MKYDIYKNGKFTGYQGHEKNMVILAKIIKRKNPDGSFTDFNLKGTYLEEKQALDYLPKKLNDKASNKNTLKFLFG